MRIHLENYRILFVTIGLIAILLFSSPTIGLLVRMPEHEQFSELYILGPNRILEDIPFKIQTGVTYSVWVGIGNQMGESTYYTCYVKLRNEIEALPDINRGTPSSLPALYEFNSFIEHGKKWETMLTFQFNGLEIFGEKSHLSSVTINGVDFSVNKESVYSADNYGFYYSLFLELWIFNSQNKEYHNRSVHLNLYLNN